MVFSVTFRQSNLRKHGPICRIILKPSEPTALKLKAEKKKIPSVKVLALIDTGANTTAISQNIAQQLKLVPRGSAKVYTSHRSSEIRNEFDVSLSFRRDIRWPVLRVLEANFRDHAIDCLIGRDVLQHGVLIYNGPENWVTLTF